MVEVQQRHTAYVMQVQKKKKLLTVVLHYYYTKWQECPKTAACFTDNIGPGTLSSVR